jgi:polysaccharide biosynthesis protein PslG
MVRTTLVLVLAAAAAALGATPAVAQAPAPPKGAPTDFVGMVSEDAFASPGSYRQGQLATEASFGVRVLRQTFDWAQIETAPGTYDFSYYDGFVGDAAREGISVLPILFHAPAFRARQSANYSYPPTKYEDLGTFGAAVVNRYGSNGSFWNDHPAIPKVPIRAVQIWNEPNLKAYWGGKPDAKQYAALLKAAYKPIKAASGSVEIVTAGMPESRIGVKLKTFIPAMYKAGAKKWFDTLAINPYGHTANAVIKNIKNVRQIMRKAHDSAKIWATELGWSDSGPSSPQRAGPAGQAKQVGKIVQLMVRNRRSLKIRGFVYFGWRDATPYAGGVDFWGLHTGLLTIDGTPKPAYAAFQQAVTSAAG